MIRLFKIVVMSAKELDTIHQDSDRRYSAIQSVADSNSKRVVSLQKKYDQLKAERNKTVRELIQENKKLKEQLSQTEKDNESHQG